MPRRSTILWTRRLLPWTLMGLGTLGAGCADNGAKGDESQDEHDKDGGDEEEEDDQGEGSDPDDSGLDATDSGTSGTDSADVADDETGTDTDTGGDGDTGTGTDTDTGGDGDTGTGTGTDTGTDSGTDTGTGTDTEPRPPNIVVVIADDQPYNMLGAAGNPVIRTPNLDLLAEEGVYFTRAYLTVGECSGSRASMWTGKLPHATGVLKNGQQIDLDQALLPRVLQEADYTTAMVGKCHLGGDPYYEDPDGDGVEEPVNPDPFVQLLGFDYRLLFFPDRGSISDFYNFDMVRDGVPEQIRDEYVSDRLTDEAIAFIRQRATDEPFFLWVAYNVPHEPLHERNRPPEFHPDRGGTPGYDVEEMPQPPSLADDLGGKPPQLLASRPHQRFLGLSTATVRRYQRNAYEMIENLDTNVGRLLTSLEEEGLAEDTAFVFISDNGQFFGEHQMMYKGSTFYEEQMRTPLIVRYPRLEGQGRQIDNVVSTVDFLPTLAELAGLAVPEGVMGESVMPLMRGDTKFSRGSAFMEYEGWRSWVFPMRGIVAGQHKLIHHMAHGSYGDYGFEFYNLELDPYEMQNLMPPREDGLSTIHDLDPDSEDGRALNRLRREIAIWQSRTEDPEELELYFVQIEPDEGGLHVLVDAELPCDLQVELREADCEDLCLVDTVRSSTVETLHDFTIDHLDPALAWEARVYVLGDNGHGAVRDALIDFTDRWATARSVTRPLHHERF